MLPAFKVVKCDRKKKLMEDSLSCENISHEEGYTPYTRIIHLAGVTEK
jgi:hypothetical protein